MFENPRRGKQARNFTTNVPKILDLKSSSEQIFSRKLSLGAPELSLRNFVIATGNPNPVLANKIISYLPMFPKSLWAVLEGIWIQSVDSNTFQNGSLRLRKYIYR